MNLVYEIKEIISKIIKVPVEDIKDDASFFEEYGMDSLRVLEILAEIENKFEIVIDPEKLMEMTNVSMVTKIIQDSLDNKYGK